jgi:hypothetical protein
MIGSSNFSAFYGNDLTPTVNFPSPVSVDQLGDANADATSSSTFTGITTDKIPVRINYNPIPTGTGWNALLYIDLKEPNDTSDATTQRTGRRTDLTVEQGKRITITLKTDALVFGGEDATMNFTLTNSLTENSIATIQLQLTNSII